MAESRHCHGSRQQGRTNRQGEALHRTLFPHFGKHSGIDAWNERPRGGAKRFGPGRRGPHRGSEPGVPGRNGSDHGRTRPRRATQFLRGGRRSSGLEGCSRAEERAATPTVCGGRTPGNTGESGPGLPTADQARQRSGIWPHTGHSLRTSLGYRCTPTRRP